MAPPLMVGVSVCFLASLLPFLFPGTLISLFGVVLNGWLGELLVSTFRLGPGLLVAGGPGAAGLTLQGVLALYAPVMLALWLMQRGR